MSFKPGQSGNPSGRPKGASDKRTELRNLLAPYAPELIQKLVSKALEGDMSAMRICIDRCIPALRSVEVGVDAVVTPNSEPHEMADQILYAMNRGRVDPVTADRMIQAIARKLTIDEMQELYERLQMLEEQIKRTN